MSKPLILVADADIIVAQAYINDALHKKTVQIGAKLAKDGAHIIFPSTTIAEAITTIQRKLSNPQLAATTLDLLTQKDMTIEAVDQEIIRQAKKLFNPSTSKHNTIFDCIVAVLAKKNRADAIFSFDDWYRKLGFTLVSELYEK